MATPGDLTYRPWVRSVEALQRFLGVLFRTVVTGRTATLNSLYLSKERLSNRIVRLQRQRSFNRTSSLFELAVGEVSKPQVCKQASVSWVKFCHTIRHSDRLLQFACTDGLNHEFSRHIGMLRL